MWSQSQTTRIQKTKMEDIDRERIVVVIGISLLLSMIVNWQLNVYAHKLTNASYTCAVEGWKRFQSLLSFPCGRVKRFDRVDAILSWRFQWNENANSWKRIRMDGAIVGGPTALYVRRVCSQMCAKILSPSLPKANLTKTRKLLNPELSDEI